LGVGWDAASLELVTKTITARFVSIEQSNIKFAWRVYDSAADPGGGSDAGAQHKLLNGRPYFHLFLHRLLLNVLW
jgi:hypothetical protein